MKRYNLFYPSIHKKEWLEELKDTFSTKWVGEGPKVKKYEKAFGKFLGAKYPVALNSCTSALHLAYILSGIQKGDEVIITVFTCSASTHPIFWQGATPVFADIKDDFTIDPEDVARKITKKTKAIVAVDYGGQICDYKALKKFGLPIIADKAQSLVYSKEANYNCFSTQAVKFMSTGDGGMLVTKTKKDYEKAKRLRWFGIDREANYKEKYTRDIASSVTENGRKYQFTDLGASLGLVNLRFIKQEMAYRKALVDIYDNYLKDIDGLFLVNHDKSCNWLYTILVYKRDIFFRLTDKMGVEASIAHARNDEIKLFRKYKSDCPNMDIFDSHYVCIPLHNHLSKQDVRNICKIIKKVMVKINGRI